MIACWSCGATRPANAALCPACNKVQPVSSAARVRAPPVAGEAGSSGAARVRAPPVAGEAGSSGAARDKFAFFGFDPGFDLDLPRLEEQFRALSRKLHPDRFARASAQERRFSLEQTTLLNDAYKTLRDPARRAEHLLQLRGFAGEPKMAPDFLEQTLEDREALLEAKMAGGPLDQLVAKAQAKRDAALAEVRELVAAGDLPRAAERLARMKYYARYLDEAAGRVEM